LNRGWKFGIAAGTVSRYSAWSCCHVWFRVKRPTLTNLYNSDRNGSLTLIAISMPQPGATCSGKVSWCSVTAP
jgi:hypothetical protein